MKERETGRSRGFGFVTFNSTHDAQDALDALNDRDLEGRVVRVDFATARGALAPSQPSGGGRGYNPEAPRLLSA